MPTFRFGKIFSIGRKAKVFLNLQGGVTRGTVPGVEHYERETEKLRDAQRRISEQKKKLESKDQEIEQRAETLKNALRRIGEQKKVLKDREREVFRLRNEIRAAKERVESSDADRPTPWTASEAETGALPDFAIIGAGKCGTTSLYDLLVRHPNVEGAALKELRYFNRYFDEGTEWYRSQFPSPTWKDGRRSLTGEATPNYLSHPLAPERMARVVPQARLIVLLRNPTDRAYSNYQHMVRNAREPRSFEEAVEAEKEWLCGKEDGEHELRTGRPPSQYLQRGIYVDQLLRWSRFFSSEQMLVLKSEDFYACELDTLKLVLDFLDLPAWEPETSKISNKGLYDEMDPAIRQRLEDFFEPHNQRLYEYLGVDFGW